VTKVFKNGIWIIAIEKTFLNNDKMSFSTQQDLSRMSAKVFVMGDPHLVERVIGKLQGTPRSYDLVEYQRADPTKLGDSVADWYIHCQYAPVLEIPTPLERSTVYVASKVVSVEGCCVEYVTRVNEILPKMITGLLGQDAALTTIIDEARTELMWHALWCFGMLIIISAFTASEHSDNPFAIILDVLLLVGWIWYAIDMIGSGIRVYRGNILDSPSLQTRNGVIQRVFAMLARRHSPLYQI
jgi:hypothetical protein